MLQSEQLTRKPNNFFNSSRCKFKNRTLTLDAANKPQFTGWKTKQFILKLNNCDNCVKMKNNDIVVIENYCYIKIRW